MLGANGFPRWGANVAALQWAHGGTLQWRISAEESPVSKEVFEYTDFKNDHCELRKDQRRNEPNEARSFSVFGPKNDYAELRISWLPIGQTDEGVTSAIAMLLFNLRIV